MDIHSNLLYIALNWWENFLPSPIVYIPKGQAGKLDGSSLLSDMIVSSTLLESSEK